MMNDSDLLAEAKKKGLDPSLMAGEEIVAFGRELGTVSPEIIQRMKQVLENELHGPQFGPSDYDQCIRK